MFFSKLSKLGFIFLVLFATSCERSTTANNASTPQATPPQNNTQGPGIDPEAGLSKEEILRKREAERLKGAAGPPSSLQPSEEKKTFDPAPMVGERPVGQDNKLADTRNTTRGVIRYYNFLTDIRGLNLNRPKEMEGGTSAFKAVDVLQFTFRNQPDDKPIAVLVAEYANVENQVKGTDYMRKISGSQRKAYQVDNYSLLILGGDEKIHNMLIDSVKQFR